GGAPSFRQSSSSELFVEALAELVVVLAELVVVLVGFLLVDVVESEVVLTVEIVLVVVFLCGAQPPAAGLTRCGHRSVGSSEQALEIVYLIQQSERRHGFLSVCSAPWGGSVQSAVRRTHAYTLMGTASERRDRGKYLVVVRLGRDLGDHVTHNPV